jgi:hypothetical protein
VLPLLDSYPEDVYVPGGDQVWTVAYPNTEREVFGVYGGGNDGGNGMNICILSTLHSL